MSAWTTLTAGSWMGAAMRTHSPARMRSNDAVGCDGVAGGNVRSEAEHSGWGEAPRHSRAWEKGERMSVAGAEGVFGGLARGVPHVVQARRVTGGQGNHMHPNVRHLLSSGWIL